MSYTFGAGTGDDITAITSAAGGSNGTSVLVMGWWYPTTLTATRGYWSYGSTVGAEVDTTTSELRMRSDNTTDGQWTTSGAGITTDKWWFLAFASSYNNTGPAVAQRVWVGDGENPPAEVTVTQATAPVGNNTGNSNLYLGNKGTGTLAFQGDIGGGYFVGQSAINVASVLGNATAGTITQDEANLIRDKWITPTWLGNFPWQLAQSAAATVDASYGVLDLTYPIPPNVFQNAVAAAATSLRAITINGATFSSNQPPRQIIKPAAILPPLPRRI